MSVKEKHITLAHGGGGIRTWELLNEVILPALGAGNLALEDSAPLGKLSGEQALTTDSFVVTPRTFPGGDLGKLAIFGTANDLAVMGARPRFITISLILEEGFSISELAQLLESAGKANQEVGSIISAGDTKVVPRGGVDGLFINTSGLGEVVIHPQPSVGKVSPGDEVIVSGDIGRHEAAVMLARSAFGISGELESDLAYVGDGVFSLSRADIHLHFCRDLTRGGLAMALYEVAMASEVGILIEEQALPVHPRVEGLCSLLGSEPISMACEGTFIAAVAEGDGEKALSVLRGTGFPQAQLIGKATEPYPGAKLGQVRMVTRLGTERVVPPPLGETNPRIC